MPRTLIVADEPARSVLPRSPRSPGYQRVRPGTPPGTLLRAFLAVALLLALGRGVPAHAVLEQATPVRVGLSAGGLFGNTDLDDRGSVQLRAFVDQPVGSVLGVQFGFGVGAVSGVGYRTDLTFIDLRFVVTPGARLAQRRKWTPLGYVGVGALHHTLDKVSPLRTADAEADGWATAVSVGMGVRFYQSRRVSIDAIADYNYGFSDSLEGVRQDAGNDSYWGLKIGFEIEPRG